MVEYFLGKRSRHSYAIDDVTYGVVNDALTWSSLGVVQSIIPNSKSELMQINSMDDSNTRNVNDYYESIRTYGATVELLLQHCRPLALAWGSDAYVGGVPDTHVITEEDTLPSFGLNFGYGHTLPHAVDYAGCVVNKMDIACAKGEFVKCSMDLVAQDSADHAFRTYQSGAGLKHYPVTGAGAIMPYQYSDAVVELNDTVFSEVQNVRLTINNNLLSEPVLDRSNDNRISEPVPQLREYDASITLKMATDDLYDLWDGSAMTHNPVIKFQRAADDYIEFELVKATLESAISPYNISEGVVIVELPMKVEQIVPTEYNDISVDYSDTEV